MEIKKGERERECTLYFSSCNARLNAASRDALGDPDYIKVEYENGVITLKEGQDGDFKINKAKSGQRFFSGCSFMGRVANVPQKTKIYGILRNKALHFEIPKEYRGIKSENV